MLFDLNKGYLMDEIVLKGGQMSIEDQNRNMEFVGFITMLTCVILVLITLTLVLTPLAYYLFDLWITYLGFPSIDKTKVEFF